MIDDWDPRTIGAIAATRRVILAEDIFGFADGDWPAWPATAMPEWLPPEVVALGRVERTTINGDMLDLPPAALDDVVERLSASGVNVERDDDLVDRACGGWRYA